MKGLAWLTRTPWVRWVLIAFCALAAAVWLLRGAGSPNVAQTSPSAPGAIPGGAASPESTSPEGASASASGRPASATAGASANAPPTRNSASGAGPATIDVVVGRNDTLDRIFRKLNLSLADLASLRGISNIKAFLDRLRAGETLHLAHQDMQLVSLERRIDESQTLQVIRTDGVLHASILQNPLDARPRTIRAVIDHSLFEAVETAGAHDQTAVNLADIFGWDIDFVLDIQRGDSFAATYQELYQNGAYVKDGPVLAASFVNHGRTYRAVRYVDPESSARYFTPDGRSMHKAFLRAPVEFTRVSSRFNSARMHPILNLIRAHKGIDYAAPIGTPVRAAGDGRIRFAGPKGGYGNVVEIEHSRSIVTVYGHLSRFAKVTHVGAHVTQGTVIAYVGMTGLATGPHLHYEYRVDGVFKNPQTVPLPSAAPIDPRWRADFLARTAPLLATLDSSAGPTLVAR